MATTLPTISLSHLDELWFQVSGTLCNLTCNHCFISCSPTNNNFGFLSLVTVQASLEQSIELGVKGYYFTGGEPFLNPDMTAILIATLKYGPATVLTNATVLKQDWIDALVAASRASRYSLEFRVSIDGFDPATNDPIRGTGTFVRALAGVQQLVKAGFLPIITATRTWPIADDRTVLANFITTLKEAGYERPRIKLLPALQIGAEAQRSSGYTDAQRVTTEMLEGFDNSQFVCEHARIVTDRGVHVCPILIEEPDSLLGTDLQQATQTDYAITHGACLTCYQYGAICSNASLGLTSGDA
jgi:molybdenum cofactor biosynthesis enzyme MoaA